MRTAIPLLVITIFAGVAVAAPRPPVIPRGDRTFDHARHAASARNAREARRRTATCADCHQMDGQGKQKGGREHAVRCVKCHKDPATCTKEMRRSKAPTNPSRRCVVCHKFDRCKPAGMPMPPAFPTYQAGFSHGRHIGFGAAIERDCARCHTAQAPASSAKKVAGSGHASCKDCHQVGGRARLQMNDCEGCHKPPKAKPGPSGDPFQLARFDHRLHHRASNQASCTTCHTAKKMQGAGDAAVPRPDMLTCQQSCHDGKRAFNAVGTRCTTCHTGGGVPAQPNRTDIVFSHKSHAARNVNIARCNDCHQLKPDGNLEPHGTKKDHAPCANAGCHLNEFASKKTKICGVCHDESMPWQKAVARTRVPPQQEWFENMNHKSHLQKKGMTTAACGDCHGDKLGGGKRPAGHDACSQCHGKGGPAHSMTDCAKCHVQTKPARAPVTEWSVAATFVHESHARDPRSRKQTQCAGCHASVKNARDLAAVKKPTMESCGRCHDGKLTFKTTGYECSKCHTRPKQPSTPTAFRGLIPMVSPYKGLTAQLSLQDSR